MTEKVTVAREYDLCDICNAGETGLFFSLQNNRILTFCGDPDIMEMVNLLKPSGFFPYHQVLKSKNST